MSFMFSLLSFWIWGRTCWRNSRQRNGFYFTKPNALQKNLWRMITVVFFTHNATRRKL